MDFPTDSTAHTTDFDGPVVDHWMEWKITQTANAAEIIYTIQAVVVCCFTS